MLKLFRYYVWAQFNMVGTDIEKAFDPVFVFILVNISTMWLKITHYVQFQTKQLQILMFKQ